MTQRQLPFRLIALAALLAVLLAPITGPATAQGMFSPQIIVNDRVITRYELDQRKRLLTVLNTPGNLDELAREQLIDDKVRLDAVANAGLQVTEEGVRQGMEEFAGRANLTLDQFLSTIARGGVAEETLRDFVRAGLGWRELIRQRFGPRAQISEAEIDRALAATSGAGGVRVLLSEIIMPAPPRELATVQARAQRISQITSFGAFAAEAQRYSATPTRGRGGKLDWLPLSRLPAQIRTIILGLAPGEVTPPLPLPNAIALFQLRAIEEVGVPEPDYAAVDYAVLHFPGSTGAAEAAKVAARVDVCDDLYGVAKNWPEERLERIAQAPGAVPQDIAVELAKLDADEISLSLPSADGAGKRLVMLCARTAEVNADVSREDVATSLRNRRLNAYAESYLAELKADALIREP